MTVAITHVCILGAGRMGQGIALAFIHAGLPVVLVDAKARPEHASTAYLAQATLAIEQELKGGVALGLLTAEQVPKALARLKVVSLEGCERQGIAEGAVIFEAVPEVLEAKQVLFGWLGAHAPHDAIVASTTSTFLVTELAGTLLHPERFLNAHWLNPAHLMPLVELSPGPRTAGAAVEQLTELLKRIGKVPVVCAPRAGYIVPRLQALVMNEAARMVEEGVASAQDIDTAVRAGLGLRFSVLGPLEFIDWGGGDILYYASEYLAKALHPRFAAPRVIADNMAAGRNGLRDAVGFYDYRGDDLATYRQGKLEQFVRKLDQAGLAPAFEAAKLKP